MISIEIPVLHGKYLRHVLESIRTQTYQNYEVIIVNSGSDELSDIISEYGFKEIKEKVKLLYARYLAHKHSKGEYALLLDETRYLDKRTLEILSTTNHDSVIVGEREVGNTIWVRASQLDKDNILYCNTPDEIKGFALARYIRSDLLDQAFENLLNNLKDKFYEIIFPDHELIYYELKKLTKDVYILYDTLINHYGDATLSEIFEKYYRYGKSINLLKETPYSNFLSIRRKKRRICKGGLKERILLYVLYAARGIPFVLGMRIGNV
ncbi:glycosyltransferase [Acidianus sulfidivorans JP7]|uniref:Glycosyl transferase family 2 n=1 Tax=Acidianus sulfidivorans JP7 TaxID=619593 RepID=A0A2U9IJT0_9CREN|nr:glycosyltransferase family 2 protein [Acidianus sulfidivorans]AWR96245.1 glycosyltransferase [Acidianus sulfidivorans JP7]